MATGADAPEVAQTEEAAGLAVSAAWPPLEAARAPWEYPLAPQRPSQALPPPDRQAAAQLAEKKRALAERLFARTRKQDLVERDGDAKDAPMIEGLQLPLSSAPVATLLELRKELRTSAVTSAPAIDLGSHRSIRAGAEWTTACAPLQRHINSKVAYTSDVAMRVG